MKLQIRVVRQLFIILVLAAACTGTESTTDSTTPTRVVEAEPEPTTTPPRPTAVPTPVPTAVPTVPTAIPTRTPVDDSVLSWWNDTVFYEIFVRSFYDSDGDGIGDLNGIIEKLDYLNDGHPNTTGDLGVTGIWLMPIMQSPSYHGYDTVNYFVVDDEYGTNEDFLQLVDEAHQRGIRVIVDLVLNHTSNQHPWFQEALNDVNSPYRDFYIWADSPADYDSPWGTRVWFSGGGAYYYSVFWEGMPDLNYENPEVTAEMLEVVRFWLDDMGVDGFRLDAIKHLVENGRIQENTPATHEWLQSFYTFYKEVNPDAFTVGEVWSNTAQVVQYTGDEVDVAFEFDTAAAIIQSARREIKIPIVRVHHQIIREYPFNQYATFLTNHDHNRVMSQLLRNVDQGKTAASLLLTGPGVPFIYYGEEVGQTGRKPDENLRTPMQWSSAANADFTDADRAWKSPQSDYQDFNVAGQTGDPNSLLSHYRRLIRMRNQHPALRTGDWQEVGVNNFKVYAFLRYTDDETLLVLINLSGESITDYNLNLAQGPLSTGNANEIFAAVSVSSPTINANGGFDQYIPLAELEPYSTYIIHLE